MGSNASTSAGIDLALDDDTVCHAWWGMIYARYTETSRYYHTLDHIRELLGYVDEHRELLDDVVAVEAAIFFHEYVWETV